MTSDMPTWSPDAWRDRPSPHLPQYDEAQAVEAVIRRLRSLPPLVTSWEIERLRALLTEAEEGKRFLLQGGDCAESLADCRPEIIANKLKILLQMSLVLVHGGKKPVIRVGRLAGQYAKPRSSPSETREMGGRSVTLPSYFGDLVNAAPFTPDSRRPNPDLMLLCYEHAAMTINFIRALVDGGFADLHHPEYWDLSFFRHASLAPDLRAEYERMTSNLADGLRFMEALGEREIHNLASVAFYTSHEGLNLHYEAAQTRPVPRREGQYCLTTHMPWIGERTRDIRGPHVEFFRGVRNPLGVKVGPTAAPAEVVDLLRTLNPGNEAGKIVLITRMGASGAGQKLTPLIKAVRDAGLRALWACDPMHGNGIITASGIKTRSFDAILAELEQTFDAHESVGSTLGGVHFELTGDDVAECLGGASGVTEESLTTRYASLCDPRLNYQQSLELAFLTARRLARRRETSS